MTHIIGLDLSLTSTGIAHVRLTPGVLGPDDVTVRLDRVTSKPPKPPMGEKHPTLDQRSVRLRRLAGKITTACAGADLVCVEAPAFASTSGAAHDRSGLWWLVVGRLTGAGLNVVEVPIQAIKKYATGRGNADKDAVLAAVVLRYRGLVEVTGNDTADALAAAALGARWTGQPIEDSLPQSHRDAGKSVRWHPTDGSR